jgi:hypothetical protein
VNVDYYKSFDYVYFDLVETNIECKLPSSQMVKKNQQPLYQETAYSSSFSQHSTLDECFSVETRGFMPGSQFDIHSMRGPQGRPGRGGEQKRFRLKLNTNPPVVQSFGQ